MQRKGSGGYVRDRLLRLGVPFAVFSFLVWPALLYALYRPLRNAPGSYRAELVGTTQEGPATVVTQATFLVRLVFLLDSQKYVDLNLY